MSVEDEDGLEQKTDADLQSQEAFIYTRIRASLSNDIVT